MGFVILIVGLALWVGSHLMRRLLPDLRAKLGAQKGRGVIALVNLVAIVLMVVGFRMADIVDLWFPPVWLTHVNNLLVLIAIWMMSPAPVKGRVLNGMRHPQLGGFKLWAFGHLLVNGDLASVILFGGLLGWAVLAVILINKAEPTWERRAPGSYAYDAVLFAISAVILVVVGLIHGWLGPYPFG